MVFLLGVEFAGVAGLGERFHVLGQALGDGPAVVELGVEFTVDGHRYGTGLTRPGSALRSGAGATPI